MTSEQALKLKKGDSIICTCKDGYYISIGDVYTLLEDCRDNFLSFRDNDGLKRLRPIEYYEPYDNSQTQVVATRTTTVSKEPACNPDCHIAFIGQHSVGCKWQEQNLIKKRRLIAWEN